MPEREHIANLENGSKFWNEWRSSYHGTVDLSYSDLSKKNCEPLKAIRQRGKNLWKSWDNTPEEYYLYADFSEYSIKDVDFRGANLDGASFRDAKLLDVNFENADLKNVCFGNTIIINCNFSYAKNLSTCIHYSPSLFDNRTILKTGILPIEFLRGCGLSEWEIQVYQLYKQNINNDELNDILYKIYELRANKAIQINPLFISYSHYDHKFVDELENVLIEKGIRFWRDIHYLKSGRLEKQIDRAIRHNPIFILVLSKNSIESDWVQHEVRIARSLEKELNRDVLCPISLDNSWKNCTWPQKLLEQITEYNIMDFSEWRDKYIFREKMNSLIDGINLFY